MEQGVVGELLRGPLGEVFDHQQLITDVSGCGNNWWVTVFIITAYEYLLLCLYAGLLAIVPMVHSTKIKSQSP